MAGGGKLGGKYKTKISKLLYILSNDDGTGNSRETKKFPCGFLLVACFITNFKESKIAQNKINRILRISVDGNKCYNTACIVLYANN